MIMITWNCPRQLSDPEVAWIVGFGTGAGGQSSFILSGPHFDRL